MANPNRIHDPQPGDKFNSWIINGPRFYKGNSAYYPCICECQRNKSNVSMHRLLNGRSSRCKQCSNEKQIIHGHNRVNYQSPTHKTWSAMMSRCNNPNSYDYPNYGGRGIKVCSQWKEYKNFLVDMGERPEGKTIGRIDNDGNYEPGNCVWQYPKEQSRNRRNNRLITLQNETRCITEWCKIYNLDVGTVLSRFDRGWSTEEALGLIEKEYKPENDKRVKKLLKIGEKEQSISQWCKELNLNLKTVYSRMARGATILEALGFNN